MTINPLVPPECDLQDFPFMPLHVARLRDSDMANEASPEACWYAVLLWAASWHQLPAGSLPNNDAILTRLIGLGRDVRTFARHKTAAMRGFVLCTDGRLYHPVVAEQAIAAWDSKLQQRWRTECARIKKQNQRNSTELPQPTFEQFLAAMSSGQPYPCPDTVPGDMAASPQGQAVQETGTETGILKKEAIASPAATDVATVDAEIAKPSSKPMPEKAWLTDPDFCAAWDACSPEMRRRSLSREITYGHWRREAASAGSGAVLREAHAAYMLGDPDVKRTGGPGFHLWLKDGTWDHWTGEQAANVPGFNLAKFETERAARRAAFEAEESAA